MAIAETFARARDFIDARSLRTFAEWMFEAMGSTREIPPLKPVSPLTASKAHDLCPRMETLRVKHGVTLTDTIRPELDFIFKVGDLYHHAYRNWMLGPRGVYVGRWKCIVCGWNTDGEGTDEEIAPDGTPLKSFCPPAPHPSRRPFRMVPMPEECPECGAKRVAPTQTWSGRWVESKDNMIVFDEWQLFNEEYGVRCKGDGWRRSILTGETLAQEIKSISPNGFNRVKRYGVRKEKPQHVTQLQIVLWLSGTKRGELVYLNKSGWRSPDDFVHPVLVEYDPMWLKAHVWKPIRELRDNLEAGTVAPRNICASANSPRAKDCPLVKMCFKEDSDD